MNFFVKVPKLMKNDACCRADMVKKKEKRSQDVNIHHDPNTSGGFITPYQMIYTHSQ